MRANYWYPHSFLSKHHGHLVHAIVRDASPSTTEQKLILELGSFIGDRWAAAPRCSRAR